MKFRFSGSRFISDESNKLGKEKLMGTIRCRSITPSWDLMTKEKKEVHDLSLMFSAEIIGSLGVRISSQESTTK